MHNGYLKKVIDATDDVLQHPVMKAIADHVPMGDEFVQGAHNARTWMAGTNALIDSTKEFTSEAKMRAKLMKDTARADLNNLKGKLAFDNANAPKLQAGKPGGVASAPLPKKK